MKTDYFISSFSSNSSVVSVSTSDCCLKCGSFDQIPQLYFNANAKKSTSSISGDNSFALGRNCTYSSLLTKSTTVCSNFKISENCSSDRENSSFILLLCSSISSNANLGECNSNEGKVDNSRACDFSLKKENRILVSTTSLIQTSPCFFSFSNLPFFISLPSLTNSSSVSCFAPFIASSINPSNALRFASNIINSSTCFSILTFSLSNTLGSLISNSTILSTYYSFGFCKFINLYYVRNDNDFAYTIPTTAYNLTDIDSSSLQDYDTKLLRLEVNYTDDTEGKTSYLFSNTTDNKYGLQSMLKPWIVLMNYQTNDQPLFITTSRKTLSAIPLKVTATEDEKITKLTFNQSFSTATNLTLAFGYMGTVDTRSDSG